MSSFDSTWHNADPDAVAAESGEPPTPGKYDVTLTDATAFESKKGDPWVKLAWQITGKDHTWDVMLGFGSQAAANFTANQVRELGVDPKAASTLEALDELLSTVKGGYYEVEVVENGDYLNTYVRGKASGDMQMSGMPQSQPASAVAGDDDCPF